MLTTPNQKENKQERLKIYLAAFTNLKEKQLLPELIIQELLLLLIKVNQDIIIEYPLLETQQLSIINILTQQNSDDPFKLFINSLLYNFVEDLTSLHRADQLNEQTEQLIANLLNSESIIIKSIQGVTYTVALCQDNFLEVLINFFGEQALTIHDQILEKYEFNETFWRLHFQYFFNKSIQRAFEQNNLHKHYEITKPKNKLVIKYFNNALLSELKECDINFAKTQIQNEFESQNNLDKKIFLEENINTIAGIANLETELAKTDLEFICRILALDISSTNLINSIKESKLTQDEKVSQLKLTFIYKENLALICGIATTLNRLRQNFISSLASLNDPAINPLKVTFNNFNCLTLTELFQNLIEYKMMSILTKACGESLGKIEIKIIKNAKRDTEYVIIILLEALSLTTTNLNYRLGEILARFGVIQAAKK